MIESAPYENLAFVAKCLQTGDIPPVTRKWLAECINRWQSGESLLDAFKITDSAEERRQRRNIELRDYARFVPSTSPWGKARAIRADIKRHGTAQRCNPTLARIDNIYRIPRSQHQLFNILK
jgi:hypothetical protein